MLFQLCTVTGILLAQCLNIATHYIHPYGWRISLGMAAVPGLVLLIGGLFLPETPNSLIERGYLQRVRSVTHLFFQMLGYTRWNGGEKVHPLPSIVAQCAQETLLLAFHAVCWAVSKCERSLSLHCDT